MYTAQSTLWLKCSLNQKLKVAPWFWEHFLKHLRVNFSLGHPLTLLKDEIAFILDKNEMKVENPKWNARNKLEQTNRSQIGSNSDVGRLHLNLWIKKDEFRYRSLKNSFYWEANLKSGEKLALIKMKSNKSHPSEICLHVLLPKSGCTINSSCFLIFLGENRKSVTFGVSPNSSWKSLVFLSFLFARDTSNLRTPIKQIHESIEAFF